MRVLLISDPNISENEPEVESAKGVDNMAYSSADEEESGEEESEVENSEDEGEEEEDEEEIGSATEEESDFEPESTESNGVDGGGSSRKSKQGHKEGERMAAAALCVNVGSFSDPDDLPGLAHFLEHMVFMGSNKYPEENAFDEFLKVSLSLSTILEMI